MDANEHEKSNHERIRRITRTVLFCILFAGLVLRGLSFHWNSRLYGDVNLFALTARRFLESGYLEYPMKYDYSPHSPYLTLYSPAAQHPPLWPLTAAGLASLAHSAETFTYLKVLSWLAGVILMGVFFFEIKSASARGVVTFFFMALSPWLVDYSANGSPYIAIAVLLILGQRLWSVRGISGSEQNDIRINRASGQPIEGEQIGQFQRGGFGIGKSLLAGALCGVGWLTHGILLGLPAAFLGKMVLFSGNKKRNALLGLLMFLLIFTAVVAPWMVWNKMTFGRFFYSASSVYLLQQINLAQPRIVDGTIRIVSEFPQGLSPFVNYFRLMAKSAYAGLRELTSILGLFGVALALIGGGYAVRDRLTRLKISPGGKRETWRNLWDTVLSPVGLYIVMVILWATFKLRFFIPLLPFLYAIIGTGFQRLHQGNRWQRWLGWTLLAGSVFVLFSPYSHIQAGLYYGRETPQIARSYDLMKPLADAMALQPRGVVLGVSNSLDGGIETVYWTGQPFVAGRGMDEVMLQKLARDFQASYVWSDQSQSEWLKEIFPEGKPLLRNSAFQVYTLQSKSP